MNTRKCSAQRLLTDLRDGGSMQFYAISCGEGVIGLNDKACLRRPDPNWADLHFFFVLLHNGKRTLR